MKPTKAGQIVRFHTPFPSEVNQLYVVLEVKEDGERSRVDIIHLFTDFSFPLISTVLIKDVEVTEVSTSDLIGYPATIITSDNKRAQGRIIKVDEPKILLDLSKKKDGVETNVEVHILDKSGIEHSGLLFVK